MIIDWNRKDIPDGTVFHFAHSLRRFIEVDFDQYGEETLFIDLDNYIAYTLDDIDLLHKDELYFYTKDDDDDFMGVSTDF